MKQLLLCFALLAGDSFEFFEELKLVRELGRPLSDAIHQLEADRPLLSQLFLTFETLVRSARAWTEKVEKVRAY